MHGTSLVWTNPPLAAAAAAAASRADEKCCHRLKISVVFCGGQSTVETTSTSQIKTRPHIRYCNDWWCKMSGNFSNVTFSRKFSLKIMASLYIVSDNTDRCLNWSSLKVEKYATYKQKRKTLTKLKNRALKFQIFIKFYFFFTKDFIPHI